MSQVKETDSTNPDLDDSALEILKLMEKKESKQNTSQGNNSKSFVTGLPVFAMYSDVEEEWIGKDSNTNGINMELFGQLKHFLEDYFCKNIPDDKMSPLDKN
jgi:hypothetical protein